MSLPRLACGLAAVLTLVACGGGPDTSAVHPSPTPAPSAGETPSASPHGSTQPAGELAPLSSRGMPVTTEAPAASSVGLAYELPKSWQTQQPGSSMRFVQAAIPGSDGAGEMAGFYFGPGQGGGLEANIDRWLAQIGATQPERRESFDAAGLKITWIEAKGTLQPSNMGMGPTTAQPNSILLGGVVEGPGGPWFFKATGPAATLEAARADFIAMLKGVRAGS